VRLLILYHPNSEHSSRVEEFAHDFQTRHNIGKKLELLSLGSRDGAATASLYDVMAYPAILVLADDGSIINSWEGDALPLMDEVAGYLSV
jgi:hypothetical protein